MRPAGLRGNPEHIVRAILVRVLWVCGLGPLGFQAGVRFLESVRDVLQEDEPEDYMLVLGGIHAAAEGVGHLPEFGFIAGGSTPAAGLGVRAAFVVLGRPRGICAPT